MCNPAGPVLTVYTVIAEADPELELSPKRSAASLWPRGILVLILGCFLLSVDGLVWSDLVDWLVFATSPSACDVTI